MLIAALVLPLLAAQASVTPPKPGSISGQVVSLTGEPIKKAQVMVRRVDSRDTQPLVAVSDGSGTFSLPELQPGRYILSAEKPGFVHQEFGASRTSRMGATVAVSAGQDVTGIVMKLSPQAVIAGKVLDDEGDPVPYAQVMVLKQRYMRGKRQWMPSGGGQVNDLGEFRVSGLQPGRYLVAASSPRNGIVVRGARSGPEETLVTTYYPGVADISQAAPIEVTAGADRTTDLRMIKARTYRVSGKLVDTARPSAADKTGGSPGVMLMLTSAGADSTSYLDRNMSPTRANDGGFEFNGILPGSYVLTADRHTGPNDPHYGARTEVTVGDQNVDGLAVQLVAGTDLGGSVRVEGVQKPALENLHVSLQTLTPVSYANLSAPIKADGRFAIEGVLPDKYRVVVFPLSDVYMRSIRYGNQEAKDGLIDLSGGVSGGLDVSLGSDGAALTGMVQDSKQRPASGVTVVLVPEGSRRANPDLFKNAATDQTGAFSFKAIPPGEYKLFAWEAVEDYEWTDPAFLSRHESEGKSLSLKPSANENLTITFIAPEGGSQIERDADEQEKNNK